MREHASLFGNFCFFVLNS
uniref:EXTRA-LARGE G-protein n=1 Tax=Rhizophora mucronata TaxID=61149 RepID=A0A2P2MD94_RHIMU